MLKLLEFSIKCDTKCLQWILKLKFYVSMPKIPILTIKNAHVRQREERQEMSTKTDAICTLEQIIKSQVEVDLTNEE